MLTCLLCSHTAVLQAPRSGFIQNPGAWPSQLDSPAPAVTTTPSHSLGSPSSKPTATTSQSSAPPQLTPFIIQVEPRLQSRTCDLPASLASPAFPPVPTQAVLSELGCKYLYEFPSPGTCSRPQTPLSSPSSLSSNVSCSEKFSQGQGLHIRGECTRGTGSQSALWRTIIIGGLASLSHQIASSLNTGTELFHLHIPPSSCRDCPARSSGPMATSWTNGRTSAHTQLQ